MALSGAALGLPLAYALTRLMATLLFGVKPGDPLAWLAAAALLSLAVVAASLPPALRAARLDPVRALKYE